MCFAEQTKQFWLRDRASRDFCCYWWRAGSGVPASDSAHPLLQAAHAAALCCQPDGLTDGSYHAGSDRWHPAGQLSTNPSRDTMFAVSLLTSHITSSSSRERLHANWQQLNEGCAKSLLAMSFETVFAAVQASYWQSQETKQVMEEEDALRSAIFAQMLSASS